MIFKSSDSLLRLIFFLLVVLCANVLRADVPIIEQIEIHGCTKIAIEDVRRELPVESGDFVDLTQLKGESDAVCEALGVRAVRFRLKEGSDPGFVVLVVTILEPLRFDFRVPWTGYSSTDGWTLSGEPGLANLFVPNDFLGASYIENRTTRPGTYRVAQLRYSARRWPAEPYFLEGRVSRSWYGPRGVLRSGDDRTERLEGFVSAGRIFLNYGWFALGTRTGWVKDLDETLAGPASGRSSRNLVGLRFFAGWDNRTAENPRHWSVIRLSVDSASDLLGSEVKYTKFSLEGTCSFGLPLSQGILLRGVAGRIAGTIPQDERFYLGNAQTLRGYHEADLLTEGGEKAILAQFEYSFPLGREFIRGFAFADTGYLGTADDVLTAGDFRTSVGVGVEAFREAESLLPIRVTLAFPTESDVDPGYVVYFSLSLKDPGPNLD